VEAHLCIDGSPSAWEDTLASALAELQPWRVASAPVARRLFLCLVDELRKPIEMASR
jgi:hypothetical protein